jgi:pyruvate,water dikinase
MAVLVQVLVDAEAAGVLFTGERRVLEAVHGLGESLVGGAVTPDSWELARTGHPHPPPGSRDLRSVRRGARVLREPLPAALRAAHRCREDRVREIDQLGRRLAEQLGGPVDLEWAVDTGGRARAPGPSAHRGAARPVGRGGEGGGPRVPPGRPHRAPRRRSERRDGDRARCDVLRSVAELSRVRPGDVLLARATDPAWTPLFPLIAAVVTETGGMLSHAAIVAREVGIPAVLAVPDAMERLEEGTVVRVDGERGTLTVVASSDDACTALNDLPRASRLT